MISSLNILSLGRYGFGRRSLATAAVAALGLGLAACPGDDNGTGPSAACIDEIDIDPESPFDVDDLLTFVFGNTRNGVLSGSDAEDAEGYLYDAWVFGINDDESVTIDAESDEFDTVVGLLDANFNFIAVDDDGGAGTNSRIEQSLNDGCYVVIVSSFEAGETGDYQLTIE